MSLPTVLAGAVGSAPQQREAPSSGQMDMLATADCEAFRLKRKKNCMSSCITFALPLYNSSASPFSRWISSGVLQAMSAVPAWEGDHTWSVDDEEPRDSQLELLPVFAQAGGPLRNVLAWHVGGANLLRDAACLPVLHVGAPHLVQNLRFACRRARTPHPSAHAAPMRCALEN